MATVLDKIIAYKKEEVAAAKRALPWATLEARIGDGGPVRDFFGALNEKRARGEPALIAEVKKASPSKGLIRADFDPAAIALAYEKGGAACLSVLTDGPSFQGSPEALKLARGATLLPVLRKDFMVDPYQVLEARAMGADAILIILAATDDALAADLAAAAQGLGMAVLAEVHDRVELDRALSLSLSLIGINNRDLKSFETRLEVTETLAPLVPKGCLVVAESGIFSAADIARLAKAGAHAYLVGESLMRQDDIEAATRALLLGGARMSRLSHINQAGEAEMVDVGAKQATSRTAIAEGYVSMAEPTLRLLTEGGAPKGDVLAAARIAAIMAAKRTHELIPLCHPLALTKVAVRFEVLTERSAVRVEALAKAKGPTGVEMEALTAVSVACLTLYDMLKAADKAMRFDGIRLLSKTGGQSGDFRAS